MSSYSFTNLSECRADVLAGKTTVLALCKDYLQRAEASAPLNIYREVYRDSALKAAADLDQQIQAGKTTGRLLGAMIAIKDNMAYKGHRLEASSKILAGFESLYTATAVQRLIDEGAIIIGRLNCDEFAMGSSNENSAFGPVRHPLNNAYVPGGSSGGSAAALAANTCMATLGSDTGGSIRQPASFCGVVGLKPTYGRVSRYGLIAFASSFDQIGPLTYTIEDTVTLYEIMAGRDPLDSTSSTRPVQNKGVQKSSYSFAYYEEIMESPGLHRDTKRLFKKKIEQLESAGHSVKKLAFPYLDHLVPCYYVLTTAEASSNLGRYDGVHYGVRSASSADIPTTYVNSRTEGFGEEVKRRIMLGTFVLSTGYYDAYYSKGQQVRRIIKEATDAVLDDVDFLISPTTPHPAFKIGEKSDDPISLYLEDIFTVQANITGNPAISIPMGKTADGFPLGLQLIGKSFDEETLFHGASLIELSR